MAEVHLVCEGMTSVLQDMHPHGLRRSAPVERRGQPPDTHHLQELCGRAAVSDRDDNGRLLLSPAGRVQMILSTMFARTHVGRPHSLSIAPFPIRLGHWLRSPRRRLIGRHRSPVSVVDEVAQEFTGATPWRGLSVNTHSYPALPMVTHFALLSLHAIAQFPTSAVNADFSCTSVNACNGTFPGCPPPPAGSTYTSYSMFEAWSSLRIARRLGPVSTLPLNANQKTIFDYANGTAYYLWIDASDRSTPEKIINCTRTPLGKMTGQQLRQSLLGNSYQAVRNGSAPCSETSSRMGVCARWQWVSHFGCGTAGQPPHEGTEPERWLLAPSADAAGFVLASMTNHIIYPEAGPACHNGTHMFARVDYTRDYQAAPDASVFAAPPDSQCPEAASAPPNTHPALLR